MKAWIDAIFWARLFHALTFEFVDVDRSQCLQRGLPRPHPLDKKLKLESEDAAENLVLQEVTQLLKFDASRYPVDTGKKKKKKKKRKIEQVTIENFTDDELAAARKLIAKEAVRACLC